MKMLNLSLSKPFFRSFLFSFLCLLSVNQSAFAQVDWKLDANMGNKLSAGVYIPGMESVLFINGTDLLFYPVDGAEQTPGSVNNFGELPAGWKEITAAVLWNNSTVLLFNGENYVSLDVNEAEFSGAKRFPGLPDNWGGRLDAAVNRDGNLIFFAGGQSVTYNKRQGAFEKHDLMSEWKGWTNNWPDGAQTVVNTGDGYLYFFNAGECMVYNTAENSFDGPPYRIAPDSNDDLPPGELIENFDDGPPSAEIVSIKDKNKTTDGKSTSTKPNTDNWCLTGNPPGNSDASLFSNVIYMENGEAGTEMTDNTPQGARLAEIRVWGKWVIYGLQTVLETPEGKLIELPILGSKKGQTSFFKLNPDECLTGIEGSHIGPDGRFIQTIKFETSKRKSKTFGSTRGRKSFKVEVPNGTSFFGFAIKNKTFLTSIGIRYVGYDDGSVVIENETHSGSYDEGTHSDGDSKTEDKYAGEWQDDYEDFMIELIELTWGSIQQLPASDWLGKGVDILTLDPLHIGTSDTKTPPIELTTSEKIGGPTMDKALPIGSVYTTSGGGTDTNTGKWVENYSDFTKQYGGSVGVSGGVGPFQGSLSGSFKKMNNTKVGSKEIYLARHITRKLFKVKMKLNWREAGYGKARQKLNLDFRNMVDLLDVPATVPHKSFESMRKGRSLPSSIERIRKQYEAIIEEYGTHFVKEATFGGKYVSATRISKQDYENSREDEVGFKSSVQAAVGPATLGANASFYYKIKTKNDKNSSSLEAKVYVQGAAGSTKYETWDAGLEKSPAVIEVELMETYKLLSEIFFPNDPDIEKKMQVLKMITEQYIVDKGIPPSNPAGKFFTAPKAIEYNYILTVENIKNTGSDTNHYYGELSCDFIDDGFLGQNMWGEAEPYAVELIKGGIYPIMEDFTVKMKEGSKGYFIVEGELHERGWWPDYSVSMGEHSKKVYLSEIPDEGKSFTLKGFRNGAKRAEVQFSIRKEMIY